MARTNNLSNFLTDIAEAIREKTGETEEIQASEFDTKIAGIESGSGLNVFMQSTEPSKKDGIWFDTGNPIPILNMSSIPNPPYYCSETGIAFDSDNNIIYLCGGTFMLRKIYTYNILTKEYTELESNTRN